MQRQRALAALLIVVGLVLAWSLVEFLLGPNSWSHWALGQERRVPPPATPPTGPEEKPEPIRLPRDRNAERKLEEARRLIKEQEWRQAIELLQAMLDEKEDKFLQDAQGRWASVRSEVNRLLSSMGQEGLQHYEQYFGAQAKALLQQALQAGDLQKLAEVAVRFLHTEAGAEALAALGTVQLDQGSPIMAALYFDKLLKRVGGPAQLPTMTLVKAAFALERAGQVELRELVWEELKRRELPEPLARLSHQELRQLAAAGGNVRFHRERFDWPVFGGDLTHTAVSEGTAPFLEAVYERPTFRDPRVRNEVDSAAQRITGRRGIVLPGSLPASFGDMILYRTTYGLEAIHARTGERLWHSAECDHEDSSLDKILTAGGRLSATITLLAQYRNIGPRAFVYNTLLGTLSTDGQLAYFVEDTPLPPISYRRHMGGFMPGGMPVDLGGFSQGNVLTAVRLSGGSAAWTIDVPRLPANSPLAYSFFLGPPLPLAGKLYALVETNGEIRLVCLEANTGSVNWIQPLCYVERRVTEEPERRLEACHLAYSDGILVCPTNAGIVLAVDLLTRSLVWAQPYESLLWLVDDPSFRGRVRPAVPIRQPGQFFLYEPFWYYNAPMIAEGKVVFTAPDSNKLYCLNLQDGTNAWGPLVQEAGDLYVAGIYHGRILIVGRERVRALNLADGKPVWSVAVPAPSGRGVANATTYFLPTQTGEVLAISLQDGVILGRSQSAKKEPLGNLLFHNGYLIAQGTTSLVAYPQLSVRQTEIARALEKNPNDPVALTERGVLYLHWGEIERAIADFRAALHQEMSYDLRRRAQQKLFEALAIQFNRNFAAYEKDLAQFEQLTRIPEPPAGETPELQALRLTEERQRRATYLYLLARGREAQGRYSEAFQAYLELGKLGSQPPVSLPGETTGQVIPEALAEARMLSLLERPLPQDQLRQCLEVVEREWQRVRSSTNLEEIKRFVALMGDIGETGVQARLHLAEQYQGVGQFAEAEHVLLSLLSHINENAVARGLEALARLHARTGNMDAAVFFYTRLAEQFPELPVSDGKTGRQIFDELATDKRFLPFLDAGKQTWLPTRSEIRCRVESGNFPQFNLVQLDTSEVKWSLPHAYILAINVNQYPQQLRIYERGRGEDGLKNVATLPLEQHNVAGVDKAQISHRALKCQGAGSLVYFSWGSYLYAVNVRLKRIIWRQDLASEAMQFLHPNAKPYVHWDASVSDWVVNYPDGTRERLYTQFLGTSRYVAYYRRDQGLVVVDPMASGSESPQGRMLWQKPLASPPVEMFGDERVICLVLRGGERGDTPYRVVALSAKTGEVITVPDFLPAWQQRKQAIGRHLLLCESFPNGQENWRLYDVLTGRNVWTRRLHNVLGAPESLVPGTVARITLAPRNASDERAGELVPHLTILDVRSGRVIASCELPEGTVLQQVPSYVLADDFHWYLLYNKTNNRINVGGAILQLANGRQIYTHGTLMRTVLVEGPAVAWDRVSGQFRWKTDLPAQTLIVERFEELPILVLASWQRTPLDNLNRRFMEMTLVHGVDKRNGKIVEQEMAMRNQFHELVCDQVRGTVELRAGNFRVVFEVADSREADYSPAGSGQSTNKNDTSAPPAGPRPPIRVIQPPNAQPVPIVPLPVQPLPIAPPPAIPKIQIQPLPVIPVQPAPEQPPAVPKIAPPVQPLPPKLQPAEAVPQNDKKQNAKVEDLPQLQQVRQRLQQQIRDLNQDGPGFDREKFEQVLKTLEELRRLQQEQIRQQMQIRRRAEN
ncbi:MAG: PQQ-binding-like beta-propeller repeat protein [Gemmatales bacterium]|nr:PQQ-binding-like beta-propeller repeat protein [Gemmatales bacterium]MDW7993104.1 PQQ-binding-like beta-propeller repeat protein [Gemmatales bacterium]